MARTDNTLMEKALPAKTDAEKVRNWRAQIERAKKELFLEERDRAAKDVGRFVYSPPEPLEIKGQLDLKYAAPILEQSFARAAVKVPAPTVLATSEAPEGWEERLRAFLALQFRKNTRELIKLGTDVQWDDARMGACVSKISWRTTSVPNNPERETDEGIREIQIARAENENADPQEAKLSNDDRHLEHLEVHNDALKVFSDSGDELAYDALSLHMNDHEAQLSTTTSESVQIKRIPVAQYTYEPDQQWADRGWEAEEEYLRLVDIMKPRSGYRNVNIDTIKPEIQGSKDRPSNQVPAESLYVRVYKIHDRLKGKEYTISAQPATGGRDAFLRKRDWPYPTDIYLLKMFRPFDPDCTYGEATLLSLRPILNELAIVQFHIRRHVENHSTTKFFGLDKAGAGKVKSGMKNGEQWWVGMSVEELSLIKWMDPPPIPDTLLARENTLISEIYRQVQADAQDIGVSNPHKQTAQESGRREFTAEVRVASRQSVVADIYSWYAVTLVKMFRNFSEVKISLPVTTDTGQQFSSIDPAEIPDGFEIYVDVRADSEQLKALKIESMLKGYEIAKLSQLPFNEDAALSDIFHVMGIDWSTWRGKGAAGPENVEAPPPPGGSMPSDQPAMTSPNVQTSQSAVQSGKGNR